MIIRPMQEMDLDQVAELEKENFSRPWSRNAFEQTLGKDYYLYLVAEDAGQILGMSGVIFTGDEGEITNVSVRKERRREGIAQAILEELLRLSVNKGIVSFTLEVRKNNAGALYLYRKLGFCEAGIRPDFYEDPVEDAVIMWKK